MSGGRKRPAQQAGEGEEEGKKLALKTMTRYGGLSNSIKLYITFFLENRGNDAVSVFNTLINLCLALATLSYTVFYFTKNTRVKSQRIHFPPACWVATRDHVTFACHMIEVVNMKGIVNTI